ncbi:MAG TPA: TPM domain-containing protein [Rhizobiaceae bacterium]|nr:TPM domain-containing protein [Rhizobiaceae bacterium]
MANAMTPDEHARIARAIRAAEKKTSGEIYCVVARASDDYFFAAAFMATIGMLVASLALAWAAHYWWVDISPTTFALAEIAAFASAMLVLWLLPDARIPLMPRGLRYRRAHDNALKQFLARNVHITSQRTGVLIFVSLTERYAEIVADAGINQKVQQDVWNGVVGDLIAKAQTGELADGFEQAVKTVGKLLAEHFPVTAQDRNELDDHVVEI